MKFKIEVSPLMDKLNSPLGSIEDRLIRIPNRLRKEFEILPGSFLCLKGKNKETVLLQVSITYKKDVLENDKCVYVNQNTYDLLDTEKSDEIKPTDDILIGCDPEFFLVDKKTGINESASHFFPHYGEVGSDCGLAELRPRPNFKEAELSNNLNELMVRAFSHINNNDLFYGKEIYMAAASSRNNTSAGYHIHFGLPQYMLRPKMRVLLAYIVNILDYYVGIPAILPEGSEDYKRRSPRFSKYGKPSDHRYDLMTLEYRVPGGHLLRHPILSAGILAISAVVMKDVLSRLKVYTNGFTKTSPFEHYEDLNFLYPNLPDRRSVCSCILSENIDMSLGQIDNILKDISSMIGYKENRDSIIQYFDYVLNYISEKEKFSENIEINWGLLENEKQSGKMEVLH
jgi:hypothetical protein